MKEKEVIQNAKDTDPEMKELWVIVEEFLDEAAALKLWVPGLADQLNAIAKELVEFKQNSRRVVAFHKDLGQLKYQMENLSRCEDPEYQDHYRYESGKMIEEKYGDRVWTRPEILEIKAPEGMYYGRTWKDKGKEAPPLFKRPAVGTARKVQDAYAKLKRRTSELLKKRKKTDPLLKEPMYKVILDRLAGTSFTALEGARVGYQVQLERGQRPTSSSARLKKSMDVRNFAYEHVLPKVKEGLSLDRATGKYTLVKDYKLKEKLKRPSGEELEKLKEQLAQELLEYKKVQDRVGKINWWEDKELNRAHGKMERARFSISSPSEKSVMKKLGLKWCPKHGLVLIDHDRNEE